jgi:hypothetical protein
MRLALACLSPTGSAALSPVAYSPGLTELRKIKARFGQTESRWLMKNERFLRRI